MKQIFLFLALSTTFLFSSCEGDPGPPGPPGDDFLAQTFEVENVNFQYDAQSNSYISDFIGFPQNIEVFESDAVLAYRYEGTVELNDGTLVDEWSQLPQNIFYQDGTEDIFQYLFIHTFVDIRFLIEGNFDLTTLDSEFYDNEIFRVVIVPAEFANAKMSMDEAIETFNIEF